MPTTSTFGPALAVEGMTLAMLSGSPAAQVTIANIESFDEPTIAKIVEVTNVGDAWVRRFPTLFDMGKIMIKIFWIPKDRTQDNYGTTTYGLRWMMLNPTAGPWTFTLAYPDGQSTDAFPAYVTGFHITGKVGDVWHADVELSNSGAPTLV